MDAFDFDLMSKETFALTKELTGAQKDFWAVDDDTTLFEEEKSNPEPTVSAIPHTPGLLYRVDRGVNTFSVRGLATDDLFFSMEDLESRDETLLKKLRLGAEDFLDGVKFFETPSIEMAEVLEDQILNRRFPIEEDVLCNLSDPGFSWWMDYGEEYFHIFFTSHGIHREDQYTKLGPMGDGVIAAKRLRQAESWLRSLFPINEFSVTDKAFGLSTTDASHKSFHAVLQLFLSGDTVLMDEDFPLGNNGKTMAFYFRELALIRKFWNLVEESMA